MKIEEAKELPNCLPIQLHRYYDYIDAIYASRDKEICEWKVEYEDTIYSTSCHNMWEFTEGDLTDNNIKFCPYCGNKIKGVTVD